MHAAKRHYRPIELASLSWTHFIIVVD